MPNPLVAGALAASLTLVGACERSTPSAVPAEAAAVPRPSSEERTAQPPEAAGEADLAPLPQAPGPPDPTLRFAKPDWTVDEAGALRWPAGWMPEAPELAAMQPEGELLSIEESWRLAEPDGSDALEPERSHLMHRMQVLIRCDDPSALLARLERHVARLRLRPRTDMMPVLTFLDLSLPDTAVEAGAATVPARQALWADTEDARTLLMVADVKSDHRTVELVFGALVASTDRSLLPRYGAELPALRPLAGVVRAAGPITEISYRRAVSRPPRLELTGMRPESDTERAALQALSQKHVDAELDQGFDSKPAKAAEAELTRLLARRDRAWAAEIAVRLRAAGFRRALANGDDVLRYRRSPNQWFEYSTQWQLGIGSEL
jgi:hypothetical protein